MMVSRFKIFTCIFLTLFTGSASAFDNAIEIHLDRTDIFQVNQVLNETIFAKPFRGLYTRPIQKDLGFTTIRIRNVEYSFRIGQTSITPDNGRIKLRFPIKDFRAQILRLDLNKSGSRFCTNLKLHSGRHPIFANGSTRVWAQEGNMEVRMQSLNIDLNRQNMNLTSPDYCNVFWGLDWLIQYSFPYAFELVRENLEQTIEATIIDKIAEISERNKNILNYSITWPFSIYPFPPFYSTLNAWPNEFQVNPSGATFGIASTVGFDPDFAPREFNPGRVDFYSHLEESSHPLSYVGIGETFIKNVINEAHEKGVLNIRLDDIDGIPLVDKERFRALFPKLGPLPASSHVRSKIVTQPGTGANLYLNPETGLIEVNLDMPKAHLEFYLDNELYAMIPLSMQLPFRIGYIHENNILVFGYQSMSHTLHTEGLEPESVNIAELEFLIQEAKDWWGTSDEMMIFFPLPKFKFGTRELAVMKLAIDEENQMLKLYGKINHQ